MGASLHFLRSLAVSVGMALATSCFGMIAGMAGSTGIWLPAAIGTSLLIALAVAHAIGRLARRFPSALGVRTYIKAAFGNTASLFLVFLYLVMITLVAGVESNLYASIVQQLVPGLDAHWIIVAVFAVVLALNAFGQELSRNAQLVLVLAMLAGVFALSATAVAGADTPAWTRASTHGDVSALPAAAVSAFFLYVGFEWVTSTQPGSRQAAAQLPRVLLAAVLLLGLVYLLFSVAALVQLDAGQIGATRTPQMLIAERVWGTPGRWVMLAVSTAAVLMAFNAGVLGASRLVYSLAREGCLPRVLARTVGPQAAPALAIAGVVGVSLACSLVVRGWHAGDLFGNVAAVLICICYAGLLAASLVLARQRDGRDRWPVLLIEGGALAAMVLLLAALLANPAARGPAAMAALACTACLLLALAVQARGNKTLNPRAAAGRTT